MKSVSTSSFSTSKKEFFATTINNSILPFKRIMEWKGYFNAASLKTFPAECRDEIYKSPSKARRLSFATEGFADCTVVFFAEKIFFSSFSLLAAAAAMHGWRYNLRIYSKNCSFPRTWILIPYVYSWIKFDRFVSFWYNYFEEYIFYISIYICLNFSKRMLNMWFIENHSNVIFSNI